MAKVNRKTVIARDNSSMCVTTTDVFVENRLIKYIYIYRCFSCTLIQMKTVVDISVTVKEYYLNLEIL